MAKIAETYFHLDIDLDETDRKHLQQVLTSRSHLYAEGLFKQPPEFAVYVEEGSLRIWIVAAGALYIAIGQYGSFRSGLDYLIKDARTFSERVQEEMRNAGLNDHDVVRFERRLGVPGQLKRVLRRVEQLPSLPADERQVERTAIKRTLIKISKHLDDLQDLDLIRHNLPSNVVGSLPNRLPERSIISQLIGLRPEEWMEGNKLPALPAVSTGAGFISAQSLGNCYKFIETEQGYEFVPK